jgi:hypothetical protein
MFLRIITTSHVLRRWRFLDLPTPAGAFTQLDAANREKV